MMLEREGYEVVVAKYGVECLEKLKAKTPDLILLDIMMPGPDDWEICRRIKSNKELQNIPVVVMFTIKTSLDSVKRSFECKADARIRKASYTQLIGDTSDRAGKIDFSLANT